jgi:hypothetical protein
VYNRDTQLLVSCRDFGEDGQRALAERFATEKREMANPDVEVLILSADSK